MWRSISCVFALVACVGDSPVAPVVDSSAPTDSSSPKDAASESSDAAVAWSPATLDAQDRLALWLEGGTGSVNFSISNKKVGSWIDRSKNHNDATNSTDGPLVDVGAINGLDAVHFIDIALAIKDSASLQFGSGQVYIAVVAKASAAGATFFSKPKTQPSGAGTVYVTGLEFSIAKSNTDAGTVLSALARLDAQSGNQLDWNDSVFDDTKFHLVAVRRINPMTLQLEVDEQTPRTGTTGGFDISEPTFGAVVGTHTYGNLFVPSDLEIAELIIIHGATGVIVDDDVTSLHKYLKKKYAL